ncbi:hypothetical protein [Snodgrassella sp. CFCC 13594]|uniref:hypothetical protein n=1 Tax=Snodgrassella sp. CFCC 13594 TaxID=1775559 RepID=UPI0008316668|nr:hypothetical protein [Snodgrassella sp. CFCC 13594]
MIELTYHQATMAVDALLPMHVLWLPQHFDSDYFMVAGRQEPRVGEVILAKDVARTGPKLAWLICHTATE